MTNEVNFTDRTGRVTFSYPYFLSVYESSVSGLDKMFFSCIVYDAKWLNLENENGKIYAKEPSIEINIYEISDDNLSAKDWLIEKYSLKDNPHSFIQQKKVIFMHDFSVDNSPTCVRVFQINKAIVEIIEKMRDGDSASHKKYYNVINQILDSIEVH